VEVQDQVVAVGPAEAVLVAHSFIAEQLKDLVVLQGHDDLRDGAGHRGRARSGPGREHETGHENQCGHGGRTAPTVHRQASLTWPPSAVVGPPALAKSEGGGTTGGPGRPASPLVRAYSSGAMASAVTVSVPSNGYFSSPLSNQLSVCSAQSSGTSNSKLTYANSPGPRVVSLSVTWTSRDDSLPSN